MTLDLLKQTSFNHSSGVAPLSDNGGLSDKLHRQAIELNALLQIEEDTKEIAAKNKRSTEK